MKKQTVIKLLLWIIVIAIAAEIFHFSCENANESGETSGRFLRMILGLFPPFRDMPAFAQDNVMDSIMYVVRKCAHFCIYFLLGFWSALLTRQYRKDKLIVIPVTASFLYAITDELHQRLVPGRYGCMRDVFIDTCGAFTGACLMLLIIFIWDKRRQKKLKKV